MFPVQRLDSRPAEDAGCGGGPLGAVWMGSSRSCVLVWIRLEVLHGNCRYKSIACCNTLAHPAQPVVRAWHQEHIAAP